MSVLLTTEISSHLVLSIFFIGPPPVTVDDITSSAINVTVVEVPEASSYQLVITDPIGNEEVVDITPEDFVNGEFPYMFENLDPKEDYEISLRYTDPAGETIDAGSLMATTLGMSECTDSKSSLFLEWLIFFLFCYVK